MAAAGDGKALSAADEDKRSRGDGLMQIRLFGHAVHPMLVAFPLGLLATSVAFDLLWYATDRTSFATTAGYLAVAGLVTGVPTILSGWLDWTTIPPASRAKRLGLIHGIGNMVVAGLFAVSVALRVEGPTWEPEPAAFVLSLAAVLIAVVTAWMGGELIERLGVSVHEGAHPDAPSSLVGDREGQGGAFRAQRRQPGLGTSS
jgi:uncharacterized membrane protein